MANQGITSLIPQINEALELVSRDMVGFIPAVSRLPSAERIPLAQNIVIPRGGDETVQDFTPAQYAPDAGDTTNTPITMNLTKSRVVFVRNTGEDEKGLNAGGVKSPVMNNRFAVAMNKIVNEIEADLALEAIRNASRATGTPGTTPFASTVNDASAIRTILDVNGAPGRNGEAGIRSLVINPLAAQNLRNLTHLTQTYSAGTDQTLRQGTLLPLFGLDVKQSLQIQTHTKGAGTGYTVSGTHAIDSKTIALTGGTVNTTGITAGDLVRFGTGGGSGTGADYDTNYVVNTGLVATSGNIVIGHPGLQVGRVTSDVMTIQDSYVGNVGFSRNALYLATRPVAMPDAGDMATDSYMITDPLSGITFEIREYKQFGQIVYAVCMAWGVKAVQPEHIAILAG